MNVTVFRIDDRLIHGQIVTAWLSHAEAKQIICADDAASNDELQKMLLQMATPKGIDLKILSIEKAKEYLKNDTTDVKTLLLVRGTNEASELIDELPSVKSINIGNLNMKTGKTKILGNVWVDNNDVEGFKKLKAKGIEAEVRAVPNDRSQDVYQLLAKENLL